MLIEIYRVTIGHVGVPSEYYNKYVAITNECVNVKQHLDTIIEGDLCEHEEIRNYYKIKISSYAETKEASDFIDAAIKF